MVKLPLPADFEKILPKTLRAQLDAFHQAVDHLTADQANLAAEIAEARTGDPVAGEVAGLHLREMTTMLRGREFDLRRQGQSLADELESQALAFVNAAAEAFTAAREKSRAELAKMGYEKGGLTAALVSHPRCKQARADLTAARSIGGLYSAWRAANQHELRKLTEAIERSRDRELAGVA